jgi:hypothetical protein
MPEVQTSAPLGEMSQRFLAMLMRQAQQIALCLGQIPLPGQDKPEIHLELAKMLIDELEMIQEKTRGNLTSEESQALGGMLTELRMAFVQVSAQQTAAGSPTASSAKSEIPAAEASAGNAEGAEVSSDDESKRRFSKSYG